MWLHVRRQLRRQLLTSCRPSAQDGIMRRAQFRKDSGSLGLFPRRDNVPSANELPGSHLHKGMDGSNIQAGEAWRLVTSPFVRANLLRLPSRVSCPACFIPRRSAKMKLPSTIEPLFVSAGWKPGRVVRPSIEVRDSNAFRKGAYEGAEILQEMQGLQVGTVGPGTDFAKSDIAFAPS